MNLESFAELVEVYGAEARRWPQTRREAAVSWMEAHPEEAADAMRGARLLDSALDRNAVPGPTANLANAIAAAAPPFARASPRAGRRWRRGAGFAALGLAGALAGALAVAALFPVTAPLDDDSAYAMTAFSDLPLTTDE